MDLRCGVRSGPSSGMIAYGFCPLVDDLQTFRLSGMGPPLPGLRAGEGALFLLYGQRSAENRTSDLSNAVFLAKASDICSDGEWAVVILLTLRFSLTQGRRTHAEKTSYPTGSGFEPTCDSQDKCLYDPREFMYRFIR
ncbi:hypothetical protein TcCL_NonESM02955 [Trypanosoma cruzi]|uniref:Uncharacterized protein n=1 Tax=Trypanosoma cruzi (strain CL Brener) TaxID=353153 RepID=Q4DHF4_TRYCC|nr:hypothetical protein, conserved [Trypanosoma cruzi]EAN91960.1 hypothetical protein, conserved [Trypanosoma cruzi]RNC47209.1 hypothetical protein TcCL_NonESM02955 [Trypanosoma cruzi]|eukprot:XP_813811.1 hypothetical protein [Trypanosoma cruzi strain CL Brener]